jgi:hypothetical protein
MSFKNLLESASETIHAGCFGLACFGFVWEGGSREFQNSNFNLFNSYMTIQKQVSIISLTNCGFLEICVFHLTFLIYWYESVYNILSF